MRKTDDKDPDTEPIVPLNTTGTDAGRTPERESRTGSPPASTLAPEQSRGQLSLRYEFPSPEATLLACTCTVALSMATGVWPRVEMQRTRLHLSFPAGFQLSPRQRMVWADLPGWARRLGGRPVADDGTGVNV